MSIFVCGGRVLCEITRHFLYLNNKLLLIALFLGNTTIKWCIVYENTKMATLIRL